MGGGSPTLVPPVDGRGAPASSSPSSSPLYPVPNPGTSPPLLCPQRPRAEASPALQHCSPSVPAHSQAPNDAPRSHVHDGRDVGCLGEECRALAVLTPSPQPRPLGNGPDQLGQVYTVKPGIGELGCFPVGDTPRQGWFWTMSSPSRGRARSNGSASLSTAGGGCTAPAAVSAPLRSRDKPSEGVPQAEPNPPG